MLDKIYNDKKLISTYDGSYTFYNISYNENYKTKSIGAFSESYHKFIKPACLKELSVEKDIKILDISLGIGMNLACTLDILNGSKNRVYIVSVEKDSELVNIIQNTYILFPVEGYKLLKDLLKNGKRDNLFLDLYVMDAISFIDLLSSSSSSKSTFDIIYFDPFSKKHNPDMWSVDIFQKLYKIASDNCKLMTYASSKEIRAMLEEAGFMVSLNSSIGKRYHPSIIAEKR